MAAQDLHFQRFSAPTATPTGEAKISLRPATLSDKKPVFEWLTQSDLTASMLGEPLFADCPPPTWAEFDDDYRDHFFDGSKPRKGRSFIIQLDGGDIGHINYNDLRKHSTELDIWLKSSQFAGKGYGTAAIRLLCEFLEKELGLRKIYIAPSRRNPNAIRAYQKAGFVETTKPPAWFEPDYFDAVVLVKKLHGIARFTL